MARTLIQNLAHIYTMNNHDEHLTHVDLLVNDNRIEAIGKKLGTEGVDTIIDGSGLVALPGFVNTHHHLYQTMFRGIHEVQELGLFPWLKGLYEFWQYLTPQTVYYGALVGFSELVRTGCTLTSDHHYVFPHKQPETLIDTQIGAAKEIGIRFHATRGSMSKGVDQDGLPPMSVVENDEAILLDSQRLIDTYHDRSTFAMTRIALAPCSPFSVTKDLMLETSRLARKNGVMMHTHLAETKDEEKYCIETYGLRPYDLMDELEWLGSDVWFAHGIFFTDKEIANMKGSGIAHCPSSNMKLNSGICRTSELVKNGSKLSIAVDGSASNDGSNMWEEVRRAYLLNHLKYGTNGLSAYEILKIATRGGAEVLGRSDTGYLDTNMAADFNLFDLSGIEYAGSHDPLVSIVCLGNDSYPHSTYINGKLVAAKGQIKTIDTHAIASEAGKHAKELINYKRQLVL